MAEEQTVACLVIAIILDDDDEKVAQKRRLKKVLLGHNTRGVFGKRKYIYKKMTRMMYDSFLQNIIALPQKATLGIKSKQNKRKDFVL